MTVIELMGHLSAMSEDKEVVIFSGHNQVPEGVLEVSEDYYLNNEGDLVSTADMEDEDFDTYQSVVVIWGE